MLAELLPHRRDLARGRLVLGDGEDVAGTRQPAEAHHLDRVRRPLGVGVGVGVGSGSGLG